MPKFFFYAGTGFCLFLALCAAAGLMSQADGGALVFVAVHGAIVSAKSAAVFQRSRPPERATGLPKR